MLLKSGQPCPDCGSSDALSLYDNGTHCFSCEKTRLTDDSTEVDFTVQSKQTGTFMLKEIKDLQSYAMDSRKITKEIAEHFGVKTEFDESTGLPTKYYFPYYKGNEIIGYKVRSVKDKEFYAVGSTSNTELFGQHLVGEQGKLLIITEGEMDALAATQMLHECGKRYKVVSIPNGAQSAVKSIQNNLEFLEGFETIMINFDSDKPGIEATNKVVDLFSPGKVKVMTLPEKDANDMVLKNYKGVEYLRAIQAAQTYRPDGIIQLADAWDLMWETDSQESIEYPWAGLNDKLYGMRKREIITLTSGSGMGKSAVTRELTHHLLKKTEDNIGVLALEESVQRTAWGIVSVEANLPLSIREERFGISKEDIRKWFDSTIGTGRIFTLDHFGSTSEETLLSRVRYLIKSLDCKWVVLDHLSIVVSAMEDGGDERKTIDSIMTRLRQLVEETGAGLILVSHLRRVQGDKGHEEGHEVSLAHLRGSQSIAQLSDAVIALERDQQADDEKLANLTRVRVLKNRYAGITGLATSLYYNRDTGRLEEVHDVNEFLGISTEETGGF